MSARLLTTLILGGAAAAVAACAPTPDLTSPVAAPVTTAAPLPVPGYDWFLNESEDEVSLTYGLAESDDVPLDLACTPGSGALQILQPVENGHPATISLEAGGETETFPAASEPSEMHEGAFLTASGRITDPVFIRFAQLGWLAAYGPDYRTPYVAQPGSEGGIARFFKLCGTG